jgi:hypothetical protein
VLHLIAETFCHLGGNRTPFCSSSLKVSSTSLRIVDDVIVFDVHFLLQTTSPMTKPTVVIDVGTGYTKMGYSTNSRPDFIIPTLVGNKNLMGVSQAKLRGVEDLDFYIGFEAIQNQAAYPGTNVMKHGQIEDWDKVEQFW